MTGTTKLYLLMGGIALAAIAPSLFAQNLVNRRYSVSDVDELRAVCNERYLFGTSILRDGRRSYQMSRSYKESEKAVVVEEMVRTYMAAGITAWLIRQEDERLAYLRARKVSKDTVYVKRKVD